jgi:Zn-dependent protease with chaperone function
MNPSMLSLLYRILLACYFPFLVLLCVGMIVLVASMLSNGFFRPLAYLIGALFGLTLIQVLGAARALAQQPPPDTFLEINLPRNLAPGLHQLVGQIAFERKLRTPDEIRVSADTVAHVYEDNRGKDILVIGAMAVATFSQEALAGVIAHELAHFAAGDVRLSRKGFRRALVMAYLDWYFSARPATFLNPVVWLVRAYHYGYQLVWALHSRQQEFAADQHDVALVGKETAAAALIHLAVTERLPWVRLSTIAKSYVASNQPIEQIFSEQAARANAVDGYEWHDALRKELDRKQGRFDSHPSLRQRLKAMGVSPKKALKLAMDLSGTPVTALFSDWRSIERELTSRLIDLVRIDYAARMEMAQIFAGRPLGR